MRKNRIRINELDLYKMVTELIKMALSESYYRPIPKNIKRNIQLMCREIPHSVISDEKVVEGCNEYGRGFYANGFDFAVLIDDEKKLSKFFSRIQAMGFFVSDMSNEFKDLEEEGFDTYTFAYVPTEVDRL